MKRFPVHVLALILALSALLVFTVAAGCGDNGGGYGQTTLTAPRPQAPQGEGEGEGRTFTADELSRFDGKDGRQAYVAVDGVVYDVTGSDDWPGGDHSPCNLDASAGKDLSQVITQAPPVMRTYIERQPVVGRLAE